jgi:hypothetical protein
MSRSFQTFVVPYDFSEHRTLRRSPCAVLTVRAPAEADPAAHA